MNKVIISDTGPLIALAKIDKLYILKNLFDEIVIPKEVYKELRLNYKYKETNSLKLAIKDGWIKNVVSKNKPSVTILNTLDLGEAEAITLAKELKYPLLIDEKKGRNVALKENVKIIGTVGILIIAKKKGLIKNIKQLMNEMQKSGYRISKILYKKALSLTKEK